MTATGSRDGLSLPGEPTGRYLVLLHEAAPLEGAAAAARAAGVEVVVAPDRPGGARGILLDELGIAVVEADPERSRVLVETAVSHEAIVALEPERRVRASASGPRRAETLARATWGLEATGVPKSRLGGLGARVAVLDTGFATRHPDFADRVVHSRSFVAGQTAEDGHGHGTHCIGTACGPRTPRREPRYGVAYEAEIWAGKVLGNDGGGVDGGILGGLNWAVAHGCHVASLSLGAPVEPGEPYSAVFEAAARRALAKGTVVVAAAGNDSDREAGVVRPVGHPANCPAILAVGAVAPDLTVAPFSNGGLVEPGGRIDVAAPGVGVHSAWPPRTYRTLAGTSMATPHVAGIVALLAEAHDGASAAELVTLLTGTARRLDAPSSDVGAGLVQAPVSA
jgi:subtilisin family serine protease